jgi:penicillin-binding protein 2
MNPQTGEILALVSLPTYDNSRFARALDVEYYLDIAEDPYRPLVNNAIKGLYPPGSVWKLITVAGVAEENVIDPNTKLIDQGEIYVPNRYAANDESSAQRFVCWLRTGHGEVDLIQSLAWSCDVYFYQVGGGNPKLSPQVLKPEGLGINNLFRYASATGIGSELGIELPFEAAGRMPDMEWKRRNEGENWSTGDTYNASFGQGYVTVTPLQLIAQVASIINDGTLHQPTVIHDFLDEEGNVVQPFSPKTIRTINPDLVPNNQPLTLLPLEDMLMKGATSLACICEEDSDYYDGNRCDPEGYRNTVNVSSDPFVADDRVYQVYTPLNYTFNGSICQPIRFPNPRTPYTPAFIHSESLEYVREGMRSAATIEGGTALKANLSGELAGIPVAGKTGTAEYCDDIAQPLGLCVAGQWPSHAWYVGYAPYYNTVPDKYSDGEVYDKYPSEIVVVAFVYNGGEGSRIALPVVRDIMTGYFNLKKRREGVDSLPLYAVKQIPAQ